MKAYSEVSRNPIANSNPGPNTAMRARARLTGADMNRDQVKGTAKDIAGKVQEKVGQATGSTSQQVKGVAKQVEGKVQKGVGNIEQAVTDTDKKTRP